MAETHSSPGPATDQHHQLFGMERSGLKNVANKKKKPKKDVSPPSLTLAEKIAFSKSYSMQLRGYPR